LALGLVPDGTLVCRDSGRGGAAGEGLASGVLPQRDLQVVGLLPWTGCGPVDHRRLAGGISEFCALLINQFQINF
jgi:hypothetical protein